MDDDQDDRKDRGFRPKGDFSRKLPGATSLVIGPEGVFRHRDGKLETLADAVDYFWDVAVHDPCGWNSAAKGYDYLLKHAAEADSEDLRRTLGWLEAVIGLRDRTAVVAAARLLAAMPATLLAQEYARLQVVFNSRKLAMAWRITPGFDMHPLPRGSIPKFGEEAGFGLVRSLPELYLKLSMLGPEMEEVVILLVEEALRYGIALPPELVSLAQPRAARG